ncbi:Guanine nucleotide exchange factor lte1, partial [Ascosphaera aggregata]
NRISTVSPQEPETRLGDMKDQPAAVASDLKVLIDLKRCWIGQCAIFCGSGSSDHGVTAGVGDSFNGDEDIEPEFSPQPQTCASQSPGAGSDGQPVKRLSRYTDVRFSHYGAFRSNDSTALPVRSRTGSTVSFDMDFESIDKPLSVDETREAAARLGQPCLRRVGHVKTDSQSSAGSFQSAHSKRHADAKSKHSRNFSDSLRTEPPQFQRSLSTKSRPRPTSQICLETLGRRNHEVRELESPVSGQDVGQKTLNQPRLAGMSQPAGSVVNEARVPSPVHDAIVNDIPALIPPQSLIRGTMFAPIDGIAHVLGRELSTLPSQSTCGRQSSHHLQRPFQSHHDDHHRPRTNGWKKDEINLTFEEPRSSNEVNVLTTDTLKTTTNGGSTDVSESIPPNTSLQSPRRLGQPPLESSIQSTTLPVLATITSVPEGHPNLDSLKAEVRTSIGEEHEDHSVSAAPGVKHLVGTPSLDSLNRKHSNKDLQTTNCDGHNNAYHNSDGEGNLSSKGILPAADFPGEFHSKRHANHMHSSSGSSLQSQVHRASFEPHRNSERWTSHDTSPPADQRGNRISQFAVPFGRHGEVSTSSGTPSSTNAQLANAASVGNNGYGTVGSTSVGGYYPRDKTQPGGLAKDGRNASLEIKTDEELRILRWLHNDKEIRIDLLAEYAAERYLEKFKQAKDKKQQSCLSNSVLMTPDASTCSIQIRTPCANEQTSEHIKAEVQRALSKASASDLSENSQSHNPSQPSSPISPITQSNRPLSVVGRGQSKTHSPNAINASLQIQNATTAPVSQSNKYPFCHSSSISPAYAGLGFGLDLSDRIPRRPSGQTPSNENTLSFGIPIPRRFPKPIGKPNKSVQGEVPTPAAYKGPELATVESGPPTERNSDDSDSSGGRLSRSRDGARAALNAKKSECKERDNIEVEEAELKRSLTNMTQTTQLSQSTEHSYSKAWSKNGNSSERGGTVARSMKFLGNKLRNNASFQGGMFKLNFRRRRDIDVHLNRFGDQSHEPSQSNGGMLPRWGKSKHTAHSDNVNVPGRVLEYRPLNVSSFDIDARIEESDGESAAIQSPLDHPSSISHSLTPSPYLCQRSKTISQSDGRSQSARALRAPENEREEGSIPRDAVPLYTDTDPSVTVKRPYHTSELAWRGFRSMDSLIEKPPKAGGCPVSSGRASTAQAAEDTDFPALHTLKTVLVSSTQESMFKATDSGEHVAADGTLMPKLAGENGGNVPNDVEASLGLEAKLEQIPGKTSSKRSSSFLRYPLNPEDRAELTNKELVHNDDTTVNDGQCPGNTSIGSDIDRKITDSSSAHGDQMQHNECINAGTPNRSAQQDLNSMQNSYQQDFHHLKDCVNNAVPSPQCLDGVTPGNCDEKTSSRQDQIESASGTRHDECSQPSFGAEPTAGESAVPSEKATSNDISPSSSAHLRERNAVSDAGHQDPEDKTKASPPDYFKSRPPTSLTEHDVARLYAKYKHAPFILAYDSKVLAEQLTLIEVSALSEIDWGDLVNMKWSNDQQTLDWATYLATDDRKGINMVIARFNLMVKWIVSEVVLTRNIHERARAISQFIHIALEARRMRNFSTMVQVTVALSSTDCVSLKNTWALVDVESKCAFAKMELLVQPLRNFKELRTEMESLGLRECCVPFVGLYVQDLKYNAQKPSHIQVEGGAQPLVNLEKYRTSASIVKSLLRLIDASTRYEFTPVSGVFERCLWISCLKDEDIRVLSKSLEL